MGHLSLTLAASSQTRPAESQGVEHRAGSLSRRLHLFTELIKLLLLQFRHDSVEGIDLNRETDKLAMKAAAHMVSRLNRSGHLEMLEPYH